MKKFHHHDRGTDIGDLIKSIKMSIIFISSSTFNTKDKLKWLNIDLQRKKYLLNIYKMTNNIRIVPSKSSGSFTGIICFINSLLDKDYRIILAFEILYINYSSSLP